MIMRLARLRARSAGSWGAVRRGGKREPGGLAVCSGGDAAAGGQGGDDLQAAASAARGESLLSSWPCGLYWLYGSETEPTVKCPSRIRRVTTVPVITSKRASAAVHGSVVPSVPS